MSEFIKSFITADEDMSYGRHIATEIEQFLDSLNLDTINGQYVVTVEVTKPAQNNSKESTDE